MKKRILVEITVPCCETTTIDAETDAIDYIKDLLKLENYKIIKVLDK